MIFEEGEDWSWFEVYWIYQMKEWGFNLTNIREGGEDNYCPHPIEEVIRKRVKHIIGKPRSEEAKMAISNKLSGIKRSEETKNKVRESIIAKQGRPVLQLDKEGNIIKEWDSGATAARELGLDKANLNACCRGRKKTCGGFQWEYVEIIPKETRIIQLNLKGEFIREFANSLEAERELGINSVLINRVCKGIQPQTYNFIFKYYLDYYKNS